MKSRWIIKAKFIITTNSKIQSLVFVITVFGRVLSRDGTNMVNNIKCESEEVDADRAILAIPMGARHGILWLSMRILALMSRSFLISQALNRHTFRSN